MNRRAFLLVAGLLTSSLATPSYAGGPWHRPAAKAAARAKKVVVNHESFDLDDNLIIMATRMYLRSKTGAPELALSTAEWPHIRPEVGKPGPYEDYYLDTNKHTGGFRDMGDLGPRGNQAFPLDLKQSVEGGGAWQGPRWDAFVKQLSTPEGAKHTTLITAREHFSDTIYAGLAYLQQRGFIRYLPPRENLHAVNRPGASIDGALLTGTNPERKLTVQRVILDKIARQAAAQPRFEHRWNFSDDDWANFDGARVGLSPEVIAGRWKKVGVKLHFTGLDHPVNQPQSIVLGSAN